MDDSLHYLIMANQMLVQKALLYKLKDTGLTIGQPKILDYLSRHNGSNQKEIARACFLEAGSWVWIQARAASGSPASPSVSLMNCGTCSRGMSSAMASSPWSISSARFI